MKIAVINFSGNVGKSTIARHLLQPRVQGAELITIESTNAGEDSSDQTLRGSQFGALQEYLQTVETAVVDVGASNVEELLELMRKYRGSHEDFDYFVVPTVPALKQQRDTIATLAELQQIGVPAAKLKLVFNMLDEDLDLPQTFEPLFAFLHEYRAATADVRCCLQANELFGRMKRMQSDTPADLAALARDETDFKALIARATTVEEKITLAQAPSTRRLARGVLPELDACFAALELTPA